MGTLGGICPPNVYYRSVCSGKSPNAITAFKDPDLVAHIPDGAIDEVLGKINPFSIFRVTGVRRDHLHVDDDDLAFFRDQAGVVELRDETFLGDGVLGRFAGELDPPFAVEGLEQRPRLRSVFNALGAYGNDDEDENGCDQNLFHSVS